ncbi:hypothetical protein P2G72_18155 [Cronobacter sakazakii]|uniref:hypothetical protein n=1 Tax=Cronobacter sakazakii TaxID=28141 RepID=UPI002DBB46D0|nr:hypothetical protein [Cronobacter sakazakii]MEB8631721.1 hypothetical protein [Cronobacter sakazakii]
MQKEKKEIIVCVDKIFKNYFSCLMQKEIEDNVYFDNFEYSLCDDNTTQLFFKKSEDETFCEWDLDLQPEDPHYKYDPDTTILLIDKYPLLNVYDEQVFHHIIFTVNSVTTVPEINQYNRINAFMKMYCFFQLSNMKINEKDASEFIKYRRFLFQYFLISQPVNEETLNAFAISDSGKIIHTASNIALKDYASDYYDFYIENYEKLSAEIAIDKDEIEAARCLHLSLIDMIENGGFALKIPSPDVSIDMKLVNDSSYFIKAYLDNKQIIIRDVVNLLNQGNFHSEYCLNFILQNFLIYILSKGFGEIYQFLNSFSELEQKREIVNLLFKNAIFIKAIMDEELIVWDDIKDITCLFYEKVKEMYRITL